MQPRTRVFGSALEPRIAESDFFSVSNIEVPQRGLVVFEVRLWISYLLSGSGQVLVDFSSGSFELRNPYLALSIGRTFPPHFPVLL